MDKPLALEEKLDVISSQAAAGRQRKRNFHHTLDQSLELQPVYQRTSTQLGSRIVSILRPHREEDRLVSETINQLKSNLYNSRKSQKVEHARPRQELLSETPASRAPGVIKKEVRAPPKPLAFAAPPALDPQQPRAHPKRGAPGLISQGAPQQIPVPKAPQIPAASTASGPTSTSTGSSVDADQRSFQELFDEVMKKRENFFAREAPALAFSKSKKFQKYMNHVKSQIGMVGETVSSILNKYYGTPKIMGPKAFIDKAAEVIPDKMDLVYHVIAKHLLNVASGNTTPKSIKTGGCKFSLVYIALALCVYKPRFYDVLFEAMYALSPYSFPGIREHIEGQNISAKETKKLLGYKEDESSSVYLSRMQGMAAFQAAFYQTPIKWLYGEPFDETAAEFVETGAPHPCKYGGVVECWRWITGHLNRSISRWTPYIVQAFLSVCGYEMCQRIGTREMAKLVHVLESPEFLETCKTVGSFDAKDTQNDRDRFKSFVDAGSDRLTNYRQGKRLFDAPGEGDDDARKLLYETSNNVG